MIDISVVIPTFNRIDVLPEVLAALESQVDAPSFEVVVVDDGSTDGTREFLEARNSQSHFHFVRQDNSGPATARNRGVELARGKRVAFLGDDTVPRKRWLFHHHQAALRHADEPLLGIIGYTSWHSRMKLNAFLRYINEYGLQFGYALIDRPDNVPFNFLYTSNLSLPRQALLEEPFDLRFPYAAWEDTELGYRLKKKGLRLIYEAAAEVDHDHPTTLERFTVRQEKAGFSAVIFHQLHPELGSFLGLGENGPPPMPSGLRRIVAKGLAYALQKLPFRTPRLWEAVLRGHYIAGLHRGWRDRATAPNVKGDQS